MHSKRKSIQLETSIEKKESIRWLENLQQSTKLFNDPDRCIHVGDRESDIYELFCKAQELKTHFLVRTCADRRAGDGKQTMAGEIDEVKVKGLHRINVRDRKGNLAEAILEIKYLRLKVLPPVGKQKKYPPLTVTVVHAREQETHPKDRERIHWKLLTDLPVNTRRDAIEKLQWYALRWQIETFHKILKSGCKADESKLRTTGRLVNLISISCILSWRVFWMTMINRSAEIFLPEVALTKQEIKILDIAVKDKPHKRPVKKTLSVYLNKIARLGGYLNRANDSPPGNMVIWRGMSRMMDIKQGFLMGGETCG